LSGVDSVPVMSIHKSKGLEFHTVIFMGLEDFPFRRGLAEKNGEEECNVFVAFSRAKERVIITTIDERFGHTQSRGFFTAPKPMSLEATFTAQCLEII
jgi:DNA helicase-2/ATP-dependent DNA helicase PcrA